MAAQVEHQGVSQHDVLLSATLSCGRWNRVVINTLEHVNPCESLRRRGRVSAASGEKSNQEREHVASGPCVLSHESLRTDRCEPNSLYATKRHASIQRLAFDCGRAFPQYSTKRFEASARYSASLDRGPDERVPEQLFPVERLGPWHARRCPERWQRVRTAYPPRDRCAGKHAHFSRAGAEREPCG